jgi:hypothetical protein
MNEENRKIGQEPVKNELALWGLGEGFMVRRPRLG